MIASSIMVMAEGNFNSHEFPVITTPHERGFFNQKVL